MNDPNATETPASETPSAPTLESLTAENADLKRQLGLAQQEMKRLQSMAISFEVTARTLASWCPPAQLG